jgi:hypothetical protein
MRNLLLAGAALAALTTLAEAQTLTQWALFQEPGNQVATPASNNAAGVTGLDMTRGPGINPSAANNSISANGWQNLTADDYFSFGFTVDAGFNVDLDELWIATRSSNTGPGFLALRSSVDGFTSDVANFVQSGTLFTNSIVDLSAFTGLTGTVEFRIYAQNDISANGGTIGSSGTLRISEYFDGANFFPVFFSGQVNGATGAEVLSYGSGINPANSLAVLSGAPQLGSVLQLGVSNTAVVDPPPAFALLAFSSDSAPFFPAGLVLPGFGMGAFGDPGELLISVSGGNPFLQLGPKVYNGGIGGAPAPFALAIPNDPNLVGGQLFLQGVLAFPTEDLRLGLTNGLRLTLGN